MSSASWAAGGMLAVNDPQNPAKLMPLCVRSWELYPAYLSGFESLSGWPCRFEHSEPCRSEGGSESNVLATRGEIAQLAPALDPNGHSFEWLEEGSVDPNDLRQALPAAVRAAGGKLLEATEVLRVTSRRRCGRGRSSTRKASPRECL